MRPEQEIDDGEELSRIVLEPTSIATGLKEIIWKGLFQFPDSDRTADGYRCESLIRRKMAYSENDVKVIGCTIEKNKMKDGRKCKYRGFISAKASEIRSKRTTNGHRFEVVYHPRPEIWHVHLLLITTGEYTKSCRADVRSIMENVFSTLSEQSCD